jgi:hypothetical protein
MDPVVFQEQLNKYKRVRSSDYVDTKVVERYYKRAYKKSLQLQKLKSGALKSESLNLENRRVEDDENDEDDEKDFVSLNGSIEDETVDDGFKQERELKYTDFWAGLEQYLKIYIPNSNDRQAILREFDKLHYDYLREANLETINELSQLMIQSVSKE